jgi:hypothetical protein
MFRKKDTDEGPTATEGVLRRSGGESAHTELPPRKVDLPAAPSTRRASARSRPASA